MTNLEKYDKVLMESLSATKEELPGLKYHDKEWDSVIHMEMVTELEELFGIQLSTKDVLAFNSYLRGREIFAKYGVDMA